MSNLPNMFIHLEEIQSIQLQRLNETLRSCRLSPFYQKKMAGYPTEINRLDEIFKFPITTKDELRDFSPWGLVAVPLNRLSEYHESFGTTGEPVSIWLTAEDFDQWAEQINQCAIDFNDNDVVLVRFPYAISVPAHIVQQAAKLQGACVVPVSSRTAVSPHTRVIKLLHKLKATIFGCMPFEAILLAETAKLMGYDPAADFPHLRGICVAGEMLPLSRKKQIEKLWNTKVYNLYGSTETGNIATTCSKGELHVAADHFLLEVLNPETLEPIHYGEPGILLVTTLTTKACPLVRYNTGDVVVLKPAEACECGRNGSIVKHLGRYVDRLEFDSTVIYPGALYEAILSIPGDLIEQFWMVGVTENGITVRAESKHPESNTKTAEDYLAKHLGIPTRLQLTEIGELYDRNALLKVTPVIKPKYIANWCVHSSWELRTLTQLMNTQKEE